MMWEEHPEYQKNQAKLIGLVLVLILAMYVGYCIAEGDWDFLKQVLLFAGAFVIALAMLSGGVWLLIKIFARGPASDSESKDKLDV